MLCAKNENSMTDYLGRFLLRFHALVDLYRLTFFAENQFLNWFNVFSCAHCTLCPSAFPPVLWINLWPRFFVCVTQAGQSPGFVRKFSNEFPCPIVFLLRQCINWNFVFSRRYHEFCLGWCRYDTKCWLEELRKYCNGGNCGFSIPKIW